MRGPWAGSCRGGIGGLRNGCFRERGNVGEGGGVPPRRRPFRMLRATAVEPAPDSPTDPHREEAPGNRGEEREMPRKAPKVVEAELIVLRDARGRIRAALCAAEDGAPRLMFFDTEAHCRAVLGTEGVGAPMLALYDRGEPTAEPIAVRAG